MIKVSSGNAAFDLGFMHEMRMQGWTKKQASVILDYMLQHGSLDAMEKSAAAGLVYEDPEANPLFFLKWAADAKSRYAWCNAPLEKWAAQQAPQPQAAPQAAAPQEAPQQAPQEAPAPATTGSVEGDAQAGQEAAKKGGGFFSKLWNGVKRVGSFLGNTALTIGMGGMGGFGGPGGFMGGMGPGMGGFGGTGGFMGGMGGMGGFGAAPSPISSMIGSAFGGLSKKMQNAKIPGALGAGIRGLGSIGSALFGGGNNAGGGAEAAAPAGGGS